MGRQHSSKEPGAVTQGAREPSRHRAHTIQDPSKRDQHPNHVPGVASHKHTGTTCPNTSVRGESGGTHRPHWHGFLLRRRLPSLSTRSTQPGSRRTTSGPPGAAAAGVWGRPQRCSGKAQPMPVKTNRARSCSFLDTGGGSRTYTLLTWGGRSIVTGFSRARKRAARGRAAAAHPTG